MNLWNFMLFSRFIVAWRACDCRAWTRLEFLCLEVIRGLIVDSEVCGLTWSDWTIKSSVEFHAEWELNIKVWCPSEPSCLACTLDILLLHVALSWGQLSYRRELYTVRMFLMRFTFYYVWLKSHIVTALLLTNFIILPSNIFYVVLWRS